LLDVDHVAGSSSLPRSITTARQLIKRIVENFTWSKFQPITVAAMHEGALAGHYAVIDGQRRAIAALIHPHIDDVPCWIVDAAHVSLQAHVFVGVNRDRTNIQPLQLYRAQLASSDPEAKRIEEICRAAGVNFAFQVPGSNHCRLPAGQTQAVSTIRRLLTAHGDGPVSLALRALQTAFPDTPGQLRGQVIEAVSTIFAKHGDRVEMDRFVQTLAERDCEQLVSAARRFKNDLGGRTNACMVAALIRFYNKSASGKARLPMAPR
jgi:hypothetical protein